MWGLGVSLQRKGNVFQHTFIFIQFSQFPAKVGRTDPFTIIGQMGILELKTAQSLCNTEEMVKVELNLVSVSWSNVLSILQISIYPFPCGFLSLASHYFHVLVERFPNSHSSLLPGLLFALKSFFTDFETFHQARKK